MFRAHTALLLVTLHSFANASSWRFRERLPCTLRIMIIIIMIIIIIIIMILAFNKHNNNDMNKQQ